MFIYANLMPEIKYKFKSSLSVETVYSPESKITVGALKELINKKQSLKTNGFDLKFKDCNGKVYGGDEELIDLNSMIIVSRSPKLPKPIASVKKERVVVIKEDTHSTSEVNQHIDLRLSSPDVCKVIEPDIISRDETCNSTSEKNAIDQIIPVFLKCSLCNKIMKEATTIQCCKKNFCYECITGYLFDPDISGAMECPSCKSAVSNYSANVTQNTKLRNMIAAYENGKMDATTANDLLEDDESNNMLSDKDMKVERIDVDTSVNNESDMKCDEQSLNVDIDSDANMFDDTLLNQISVSEAFEYEIQSYTTEMESRTVPETIATPYTNITNQSDEIHNYIDKVINNTEFQVQPNYSGISVPPPTTEYHVLSDDTRNSRLNNSTNQTIKDLDFDPVLYMKFVKIVGEKYPDELRKILSNNSESNNLNKEERKSTSSRNRSRDDDCRDKIVAKKSRRNEDSSDNNNNNRYKNNNIADKRMDSGRYYEDNNTRRSNPNNATNNSNRSSNNNTTIVNATTTRHGSRSDSNNRCHRSKERYMKKGNGMLAQSQQGASSSSTAVAGDTRRYRSRSGGTQEYRSRDMYHQSRERHGRAQEPLQASYHDDNRRYNRPQQDFSSTSYRDRQYNDRRSDR